MCLLHVQVCISYLPTPTYSCEQKVIAQHIEHYESESVLIVQSCLILCDPMDGIAHQAPLSMEFSRKDYQRGNHSPSPGIFPIQGSLQAVSSPSEQQGKPIRHYRCKKFVLSCINNKYLDAMGQSIGFIKCIKYKSQKLSKCNNSINKFKVVKVIPAKIGQLLFYNEWIK